VTAVTSLFDKGTGNVERQQCRWSLAAVDGSYRGPGSRDRTDALELFEINRRLDVIAYDGFASIRVTA
jgi:hypothetical protein